MKKITLISKICKEYPQNLLKLSDTPDILFAIGNVSLLNTFSIAVVGSRNYTLDGKGITMQITKDLVRQGITIISGMARGIDTIAHKAAIDAGGNTIAILGCGFSIVEYQKIYTQILENNRINNKRISSRCPSFQI